MLRRDVLNSDSNIETRVASFVTDMSLSQLLKHKLSYWCSICGLPPQLMVKHLDHNSIVRKVLFKKLSYGPSGNRISICTHFTFMMSIILEMTPTLKRSYLMAAWSEI